MLNDFSGADKVYIACGYIDLRRGIDGLASTVHQHAVSILWETPGPDQSAVLGRGWIFAAV